MKILISSITLFYVANNAYAGNTTYSATCIFSNTIRQYDNVAYYSDDMMTYTLTIEKDGKAKKIRIPKNSCIVEENSFH